MVVLSIGAWARWLNSDYNQTREASCTKLSDESRQLIRESQQGERNNRAELTEKEVKEILALKGGVLPQEGIALKFKIDQSTVSNIHTGRRWASVTGAQYEKRPLDERDKSLLKRGSSHH